MQLQNNEKILYKTKPINSIYLFVLCMVIGIYAFFALPLQSKHFIMFGIFCLLSFFRFFDSIIITNQRIISHLFLRQRTVQLSTLQQPPFLTIDPKKFRQYEWQRKLLKQNFQDFWFYKTDIYFKKLISAVDPNPLERIPLSLFSKKQKDRIIQTLAQSWQLDPTIEHRE